MILLECIGHEYFNEVSDIIKLFYGKTKIIFHKNGDNSIQGADLLLTSRIIFDENLSSFTSSYINLNDKNNPGYSYTYTKNYQIQDKKEIKTALKISMYKLLSDVIGIKIPWGILTGIRPVKIVHQLLDIGISYDEILNFFQKQYFVDIDRAQLTLNVAKVQRKYIETNDKNKISLYIGIPFCPTRCYYCSFTSNSIIKNKELVKPYINSLILEIKEVSKYLISKGIKAQSIYIGGGTPTSIEASELDILLNCINEYWKEYEEFTCEAGRPDTISVEKLKTMKEAGITRLSINPQTMDDNTLKMIGRKHNSAQIIEAYYIARSLGFDNINMDIIIGLPGEGLEHIENTIDYINKLNPENVTMHTLAIKRASVYNETDFNNMKLHENKAFKMMELARNRLELNGYYPYYLYRQKYMADNLENIGYCKKDKECIYNIQIMEERQSIVAFGADAVTKVYFAEENRLERQHNIKDLKLYIENIDAQIDKKIKLLSEVY
ncbi:MAG TPA: coproporphyrinogen dehydrogenase HemZ [Clostridiales bacterium]|nr:coproporphyrinogen dehydrogenase HemZ [Clostridiales bacterium]